MLYFLMFKTILYIHIILHVKKKIKIGTYISIQHLTIEKNEEK